MSSSPIIQTAVAPVRNTALQAYGLMINDMQAYDNHVAAPTASKTPSTQRQNGRQASTSTISDIGASERANVPIRTNRQPVPTKEFADSTSIFSFDSADYLPAYTKDVSVPQTTQQTSPASQRSFLGLKFGRKSSSTPIRSTQYGSAERGPTTIGAQKALEKNAGVMALGIREGVNH